MLNECTCSTISGSDMYFSWPISQIGLFSILSHRWGTVVQRSLTTTSIIIKIIKKAFTVLSHTRTVFSQHFSRYTWVGRLQALVHQCNRTPTGLQQNPYRSKCSTPLFISEMMYYVSIGKLNPTQSPTHLILFSTSAVNMQSYCLLFIFSDF